MGNGVTGIETASLHRKTLIVPNWQAMEFVPMDFPLSARIEDSAQMALRSLCARGPPCVFTAGYHRPLGETLTEFFVW